VSRLKSKLGWSRTRWRMAVQYDLGSRIILINAGVGMVRAGPWWSVSNSLYTNLRPTTTMTRLIINGQCATCTLVTLLVILVPVNSYTTMKYWAETGLHVWSDAILETVNKHYQGTLNEVRAMPLFRPGDLLWEKFSFKESLESSMD
jgi:hypothetical protein